MCVLCCEGDGRGEAVVEFMNWGVEVAGMEEKVGVVEEDFANEDTGWELPGYGSERRQCGCDYIAGGFATQGHDDEDEGGVEDHVEELVSGYDVECVPFLGGGWLLGDGLEFVAVTEVGRDDIQNLE